MRLKSSAASRLILIDRLTKQGYPFSPGPLFRVCFKEGYFLPPNNYYVGKNPPTTALPESGVCYWLVLPTLELRVAFRSSGGVQWVLLDSRIAEVCGGIPYYPIVIDTDTGKIVGRIELKYTFDSQGQQLGRLARVMSLEGSIAAPAATSKPKVTLDQAIKNLERFLKQT